MVIRFLAVTVVLVSASGAVRAGEIKSVSALTEVFGDGQKITAAILDYGQEISGASLTTEVFDVEGRTVTDVFSTPSEDGSPEGTDGRYVVVRLSPDDPGAGTVVKGGRTSSVGNPTVSVRQLKPVRTVAGNTILPDGQWHTSTGRVDLVVRDFRQAVYSDPRYGESLNYNLFVPRDYDPGRSYPLVLFMHDASATSTNVLMTLIQGNGAIVWAEPSWQERHPCFVLAPQYASATVNDNSEASEYLDITIDLIRKLSGEYSIDTDRIYTTGQSGGCMMSIAMNIKYPGFFAASYLVAGQWDASLVVPMADQKLWIVVSEGNVKAFPGMNAITDTLASHGARVARGVWDGRSTPAEFRVLTDRMEQEGANVNYAVFEKGTVVPKGIQDSPASEHIYTWTVAYNITGIREWLFAQTRGMPLNGGPGAGD